MIARQHIAGALLTLLAAAGAAAEPFDRVWRVADLARATGAEAVLGDRDGRALHRVPTAQMRRLYAVERALEAVAETSAELVVVEGTVPNAFAGSAAGGRRVVGINLAMLELLGDDMHAAAALLGHELAHLVLEHGRQTARANARSSVLGTVGGLVLGGLGVPGAGAISDLTVSAVQSGYSRDNEREADYLGTIWAVEAGFDPAGAVNLHERLGAVGGGVSFFSSHPSGPERIATLRALAARLARDAGDPR